MEQRSDKQQLFKKYLAGTHTVDELEGLLVYFQLDGNDEGLAGMIEKELERVPQTDELPLIESMATDVQERLNQMVRRESTRHIRWRWSGVAAAVAILLVVGLFFWSKDGRIKEQGFAAAEILPGGNRATLTLADGRTVQLSEGQSGIIISDDENISYQDGTELWSKDERMKDEGLGAISALQTKYYLLSTPRGGTYQVTLPDGSKVWLNAASTLKYPSRFSDSERVVELEGEAYFEVRQQTLYNRHKTTDTRQRTREGRASHLPFRVVTKDQTVEVLGTQFNLSAYADDPATKTTLVEGSVKVLHLIRRESEKLFPSSQLLMPGEQGVTSQTGLTKHKVDVSQFTAWKDGTFSFSEEPLESILRQASRWYDVSIAYVDTGLKAELFEGLIPRYADLGQLLGALESAGDVRFEMKDREVRVYRKGIK